MYLHHQEDQGQWQGIKIPHSKYYPSFGWSLSRAGDLNQDGTQDLCAFMRNKNANVMLFFLLQKDGKILEVKATDVWDHPKIGSDFQQFGASIVPLGDLNGDGWEDLAISDNCRSGKHPSNCSGALLILFMGKGQKIKEVKLIDRDSENLTLEGNDFQDFGHEIANLGDLDGDGSPELAVSSTRNPHGEADLGQVHILFLRPNGTIKKETIISGYETEFNIPNLRGKRQKETSCCQSYFGHALAALGDVDGDGVGDIAIGDMLFPYEKEKISGKIWIALLRKDGSVKETRPILNPYLDQPFWIKGCFLRFGASMAGVGDLDGNGVGDFMVQESRKEAPQNSGYKYGKVRIFYLKKGGEVLREEYVEMPDASFGSGTTWFDAEVGDSIVKTLVCNRYGFHSELDHRIGHGLSRGHNGEMFFFRRKNKKQLAQEPTESKPDSSLTSLDSQKERVEEIEQEIQVVSDHLTLRIWDGQQVDGDIVSLKWNNKWTLRNYKLKREVKTIYLSLEPGKSNRLFLFAENLGSIPPNTATFSIDDGKSVKEFKLTSDFAVSQGIRLVRK